MNIALENLASILANSSTIYSKEAINALDCVYNVFKKVEEHNSYSFERTVVSFNPTFSSSYRGFPIPEYNLDGRLSEECLNMLMLVFLRMSTYKPFTYQLTSNEVVITNSIICTFKYTYNIPKSCIDMICQALDKIEELSPNKINVYLESDFHGWGHSLPTIYEFLRINTTDARHSLRDTYKLCMRYIKILERNKFLSYAIYGENYTKAEFYELLYKENLITEEELILEMI